MLATVRDVAIIVLALESIVLLVILIFIAWKAYQLMRFFRSKAEEFSAIGAALMNNAQQAVHTATETATTVRGSADFVSDTVVSPIVQVVSAVAGARGFVTALFKSPTSSRDGGHR